MIDELKKLLGEERLARLAEMPLVKERKGLQAHLQEACEQAAKIGGGPAAALQKALTSAGAKLKPDDVAVLKAELLAKQAVPMPAPDVVAEAAPEVATEADPSKVDPGKDSKSRKR